MNTNLQVVPKQSDERIGQYAQRLMVEHPELKNHEILTMVKDQFKDGNTQMASIAWYKSDLKRKGVQATSAPQEEEVERTVETVELEVEKRTAELEELKKELEFMKQERNEKLLAEKDELMKKLEEIKRIEKEMKKEEVK